MLLKDAGRRDREFPPSQYHRIYQNTTQDSPLRACIVEMWPDMTISNSELYPRELLVDLVNRLGPMKRKLEEGSLLGTFAEGDMDLFSDFGPAGELDADGFVLDIERPIAEKTRANLDMLEAPQKGNTKRKLAQTDFTEENTRGSNA
jgi:hypothetical protein